MKKILFPTEFSDHAGEMFRHALELARQFDARLIVMHAYGRPEGLALGDDDSKRNRALEKLQDFVKQYTPASLSSVDVRYATKLDYPSDAIIKLAKEEKANLIVLGMTGKTNESNRHLGSNSLKVIRNAKMPVLAIPDSAVYQPVKKIVFTTDFEYKDLEVLRFLDQAFKADIHVIHVVEKSGDRDQAVKKMTSMEDNYTQHPNIHYEVIVGKDVEKSIEAYVEEHQAELLTMTSHKRSIIGQLLSGSTTRNIAKKTKTPLLVFKND